LTRTARTVVMMSQRVVRVEVIQNAVGRCLLLLERLDNIEEVLGGKRDGHDTGGFIDEVVVSQKSRSNLLGGIGTSLFGIGGKRASAIAIATPLPTTF